MRPVDLLSKTGTVKVSAKRLKDGASEKSTEKRQTILA
jgi:hypothetical protein